MALSSSRPDGGVEEKKEEGAWEENQATSTSSRSFSRAGGGHIELPMHKKSLKDEGCCCVPIDKK